MQFIFTNTMKFVLTSTVVDTLMYDKAVRESDARWQAAQENKLSFNMRTKSFSLAFSTSLIFPSSNETMQFYSGRAFKSIKQSKWSLIAH